MPLGLNFKIINRNLELSIRETSNSFPLIPTLQTLASHLNSMCFKGHITRGLQRGRPPQVEFR